MKVTSRTARNVGGAGFINDASQKVENASVNTTVLPNCDVKCVAFETSSHVRFSCFEK